MRAARRVVASARLGLGRIAAGGLIAAALLCGGAVSAYADGALDPSFGQGGSVIGTFPPNGWISDAARAPDGSIVVAGGSGDVSALALSRFSADGALDTSFGSGGVALLGGGFQDWGLTIAVQPDGRIVVAGYRQETIAGLSEGLVARFLANGQLDPSFGSGGVVVFAPSEARV